MEINDFYKKLSKNYEIILERTKKFLNWRFSKKFGIYRIFLARNLKENKIVGYIVIRKRENVIYIVDLVNLPNEDRALMQLINTAVEIGLDEGVNLIRCWLPNWHKNVIFLNKLKFIPLNKISRLARQYSMRFILYDLKLENNLPNINEYFYTLADTDFA